MSLPRLIPLTSKALTQVGEQGPLRARNLFISCSQRVSKALEPLVTQPSVTPQEITTASDAYLEAIDPIFRDAGFDFSVAEHAVLDVHSRAQIKLAGAGEAGARLRRTLDDLFAVEPDADYVKGAVLCAGAMEALDRGALERSRELIKLADTWVLIASAGHGAEPSALSRELEPFAPPPSVLAALERSLPDIFVRRERPFEKGERLAADDVSRHVAAIARRATLNMMLRSPHASTPAGAALGESLREALNLSPTVAHEYGTTIASRLEQAPQLVVELTSSRSAQEEAEARLFV